MNIENYPAGFVTIVFTDIQGSTKMTNRLNETDRELYERELRNPHRDRLFAFLNRHGGHEIQRAGDGHMLVFAQPQQAVACLVEFQTSLREEPIRLEWEGETFTVRVRAGIHTAERAMTPQLKTENGQTWIEYPGQDTNFAARVSGLGDGEQILLSRSTLEHVQTEVSQYRLHAWADRYLKSFEDAPQTVYELLYYAGQEAREPGLRFFSAWYQDERNRYVTREDEERAVLGRFLNPIRGKRSRLVTIHAEGGMGKTRLSVACALRVAGLFDHAIHFVKLGEVAPNPYAVAEAIGGALGKQGPQAQPDALCEALRHEKMLLVLDNYESCSDEEVAHFLNRLISQTTSVHLLVTSRQPVGIRNIEQIVSLKNGFTYAQARELFLERAMLDGEHDHPLSAEEEAQLNRILRLVSVDPEDEKSGPIPLAVELAAAWWSEKKLKEIADGLEATPLKKYTGAVPGMVADDHEEAQGRHDSLTRSFDWSYNLLGKTPEVGERLQMAFAVCGLFPETFSAEAVQRIDGDEETDDLLVRLHRASLLQERGSSQCTMYRFHRFGREYARARLQENPRGAAFISEFVAFYAEFVNQHKNLNLAANRAAWDEEWSNALAAADWAAQTQNVEPLFVLSQEAISFLRLRSLWSEWESLCLLSLDVARKWNSLQDEAKALNNLGSIYQKQSRWQEAEEVHQSSLNIYRQLGDRLSEGRVLTNLGGVYQGQGHWQEAEETYQDSLDIYRELGDRSGQGDTLNNLGLVYQMQGRWQEAEETFQSSLNIYHELGDRLGQGRALNHLGIIYQKQGRWQEVAETHRSSLNIYREFGDRSGEARVLTNLGIVYQIQGRWQEAGENYRNCLTIYREIGDRMGQADMLTNLGLVYQGQGRWQEAEETLQSGLIIYREFGDRIGEGVIFDAMASVREEQGDLANALVFAQRSVQILEGTESALDLAEARKTLARIEEKIRAEEAV